MTLAFRFVPQAERALTCGFVPRRNAAEQLSAPATCIVPMFRHARATCRGAAPMESGLMAFRPQLNITCSRCGQRREGIVHVCRSNSRRKATVKPVISFGKCGKCHRPYGGNPLAHVCKPKSDFKRRKKKSGAKRKRQAEKHDYQACADKDCPRSLCVAFKTGRKLGYQEGFGDGFAAGAASSGAA